MALVGSFLQRPDNADLMLALAGTTKLISDAVEDRLEKVLSKLPAGHKNLVYRGSVDADGKNPKITTEAMAKSDALNQIILLENVYHKPGICEVNFETLATVLSGYLEKNDWASALAQAIDCMRKRRTTNEHSRMRPGEIIHANYVRLLNALIHDLKSHIGTPGMQVGLYQYVSNNPDPKVKPTIYDMKVEPIDGIIIKTARPYDVPATAVAEVARYVDIGNRRMQLGDTVNAGRRTRRRRAFKRRPKQTRKRMSRRA